VVLFWAHPFGSGYPGLRYALVLTHGLLRRPPSYPLRIPRYSEAATGTIRPTPPAQALKTGPGSRLPFLRRPSGRTPEGAACRPAHRSFHTPAHRRPASPTHRPAASLRYRSPRPRQPGLHSLCSFCYAALRSLVAPYLRFSLTMLAARHSRQSLRPAPRYTSRTHSGCCRACRPSHAPARPRCHPLAPAPVPGLRYQYPPPRPASRAPASLGRPASANAQFGAFGECLLGRPPSPRIMLRSALHCLGYRSPQQAATTS
jgi:hypothetical protein